ncbi:MAG: TIGR02996 domain-containing protein [Polyangiaceae bacterium]
MQADVIDACRRATPEDLERVRAELGVALTPEDAAWLQRPFDSTRDLLGEYLGALENALGSEHGLATACVRHRVEHWCWILAVRVGDRLLLCCRDAWGNKPNISAAFRELARWQLDLAKNRARALAWVDSKPADALSLLIVAERPRPTLATATAASLDALHAAVAAAPDDDAPRQVLADAFAESGNPRGEFIQLELALERTHLCELEARAELRRRANLLERSHGAVFAPDVAATCKSMRFRRGFVEEVTITAPKLAKHGPALRARNPIRRWVLDPTTTESVARLRSLPEGFFLDELTLEQAPDGSKPILLEPLADSPHLTRLRALTLQYLRPEDTVATFAKLKAPLAALSLTGEFSVDVLEGLHKNQAPPSIQSLRLSASVDAMTIRPVAHGQAFHGLRDLKLGSGIGFMASQALFVGPNLQALASLTLASLTLDDRILQLLAERLPPTLRSFSIPYFDRTPIEALVALVTSERLANLDTLVVGRSRDLARSEALARSLLELPDARGLRHVVISGLSPELAAAVRVRFCPLRRT